MKRHLAGFAAAISLICAAAHAQAAPAVDAAATQAAQQLLVVSKTRDLMALSLQQAEQQFPAQMQAMMAHVFDADTTLSAQQKADANAQLAKALPAVGAQLHTLLSDPTLVDAMMAEIAPLYAQTYTVDELHQLTAFYQSPLGQKMLATAPKLMGASMEISNRVMMPRLQKLMAEMVRQMTSTQK